MTAGFYDKPIAVQEALRLADDIERLGESGAALLPLIQSVRRFPVALAQHCEDHRARYEACRATWLQVIEREPVRLAFARRVEGLIADRAMARKARDYRAADMIRETLAGYGVTLEDRADGTTRWRSEAMMEAAADV